MPRTFYMLYLPNYAVDLRCIGQVLQSQNIEVFELTCDDNDFRVQGANPNPPDTGLVELRFSLDDIKILDREGQARRRQSKSEFRFDSLSEILRAVGKYIDDKRGAQLRRLNNCCVSDQDEVEIEYQTRAGEARSETLSMSAIREIAVNMYKKRSRLSNPIGMVTR
jgi:hypothetical protein